MDSIFLLQNEFQSYCCSSPGRIVVLWYQWVDNAIAKNIPIRTLLRASLTLWITKETSHPIKCLQTAKNKKDASHEKVKKLTRQVETNAELDK